MIQYKPFNIVLVINNEQVCITIVPTDSLPCEKPHSFDVLINGIAFGSIHYVNNEWISTDIKDEQLVEIIGTCIYKLYDKGDRIFKKLVPVKLSVN